MPAERLEGWKAIGGYLRVSGRTARRWAQEAGLPVHRVPLAGRFLVLGMPPELDAWLASGGGHATAAAAGKDNRRAVSPRAALTTGIGVLALGAIAVGLWFTLGVRPPPSQAPPPAAGPSPAQSGPRGAPAYAEPKSSNRIALTLEPMPGDRFVVEVLDGGMATLARPGGDKLGLAPVLQGGQLELVIFRLFQRRAGAAESAHQLAIVPLRRGGLSQVEAGASRFSVTWTDSQAPGMDAPARPDDPCCISCGDATVCSSGVSSTCGQCGSLAARSTPVGSKRGQEQ